MRIRAAAFDRDADVVILAQDDGVASIWHVQADLRLVSLRGHRGAVTAALFFPDDRRAITTSLDGTVCIWEPDGTPRPLAGHDDAAMCAVVSPDGARVISGGQDARVEIWDARTGDELARREGHASTVLSVAIDGAGRVAAGGEDGRVTIWSPDGDVVAVTERGGSIWNLAFAPRGDRLLCADGLEAWLWEPDGAAHAFRPEGGPVYGVAFAPDGRIAVSAGSAIAIVDPDLGRELARFEAHAAAVNHVAWSRRGDLLVSSSDDGSAIVWSAKGEPLRRFRPE